MRGCRRSRRESQQHVPDRAVRSVAVDSVRDDGVGHTEHRLLLGAAREGSRTHESHGVRPLRFSRPLQLDDPLDVIERDDRASHLARPGREDLVAGVEAVVLRLEPVAAMDHDSLAVELVDEDEARQRVTLVDQLFDRQIVFQLEIAPPL